jgi:hypothetical protein
MEDTSPTTTPLLEPKEELTPENRSLETKKWAYDKAKNREAEVAATRNLAMENVVAVANTGTSAMAATTNLVSSANQPHQPGSPLSHQHRRIMGTCSGYHRFSRLLA